MIPKKILTLALGLLAFVAEASNDGESQDIESPDIDSGDVELYSDMELDSKPGKGYIKRPKILPQPYQPYKKIELNGKRDPRKICFVKPGKPKKGKKADDSKAILKAFKKCNNGGTIVLDKEYSICTAMDIRFLKHVDVALTGKVEFCNGQLDKWQHSFFKFKFQNASSWWVWGGEDVNLYGAGVGEINGNAQEWWDAQATNSSVLRPILFIADGWKGGSITGLKIRQSPNWHHLIANSSDLLISDIDIFSRSTSNNFAKNLDGWDTFRSDNIVIQNSVINHDDDCVSFKPNSTNVIVQGLWCNGSHGISVGSLGNYPEDFDIVSDLWIYNNTMANTTTAARLKVWPGAEAKKRGNPPWVGGGGKGYVRNVTYDTMINMNNGLAIQIDQCYGAINASECEKYPSGVILTDVTFRNFWGDSDGADSPTAGTLICGSEDSCDNIRAENVTLTQPSGKEPQWKCRFMDQELMKGLGGVGCVPG